MLFSSYFVLTEAFEKAYANWVKQGATEEAVELAVDAFKLLKQRQILRGVEGDISGWVKKSFAEFQQFVQQKQEQHQQKNLQKQTVNAADKVFENDKCLVVVPHTYEASCKYGANTKWCTASNQTNSHWNQYRESNVKFYYIIPKDNSGKFAAAVYPHTENITEIKIEAYNAKDKLVDLRPILKKFHLSKLLFQNIFTWDQWLKTHNHEIHEDGEVSIFEDVNLAYLNLKKLPFRFKIVTDSFYCHNNQLIDLDGSPSKVGGSFFCSNNKLTNLIGGPIDVGDRYSCTHNMLTNLAGAPHKIGGDFLCGYNPVSEEALLKTWPRTDN